MRSRELPTLIVVNKMDKENADYWKVVDGFKEFSPRPVSIQAPIGHEAGFKGVVDLLTRKAYEFDAQGRAKEVPMPSELAAEVESRRSPLVEAAAETDDALLEKYLESGELSDAEVTGAFARGVAAGSSWFESTSHMATTVVVPEAIAACRMFIPHQPVPTSATMLPTASQ